MDAPGFGAHLSHSGTAVRGPISCLECHAPCAPAPAQKVAFGALARAEGAAPLWSDADQTCAGVYCHGATGLTPTAPVTWAYVDPDRPRPAQETCGACHGYPPPPPHTASTSCATCHSKSVKADGTIDLAGGHHVDGVLDVSCNGCHEFPPQTGAHVAHAGPPVDGEPPLDHATLQDRYPGASPTEAPAHYAFGCGSCHSLDPALHHDGKIDLVLAPQDGPAGSLKARNAPGAAYDGASGTCSGVYCHSTGQEVPGYAVTPAWTSGVKPGCAGCHANPPAYPSGGPGAPDANGHVNLADDGYEFGHFLGVPGVWHGTKHGSPGAAPITCQSCHFDTVDPANTAPGGFYYLDTTGTYQLAGGDPGRIDWGWTAQLDCTSCHTGAADAPPQGTGRVLPLRHVNGTRDVVFDPRTSLPPLAWLPPAPSTPVKPYWTAESVPSFAWGPTAVLSGSTMSYDLTTARYDARTKTCSGAACHLEDVPVWGKQNGYGGDDWPNCYVCHSEF
jgi:predicted CxxxxCH...CXXCH cytochrome family protein